MSARDVVRAIEQEAKERARTDKSDAYELEVNLVSGRRIRIAPLAYNGYYLQAKFERDGEQITTYLAYEHIEQVTPLWL